MYTILFFLLIVSPISLVSMDVEIPFYDSTFLVWCDGLTCKELKHEEVFNLTPQQFLGTNEKTVIRDLPLEEGRYGDFSVEKRSDTRLAKRWRHGSPAVEEMEKSWERPYDLGFGDYGVEYPEVSSDKKTVMIYFNGRWRKKNVTTNYPSVKIYPNSIPYERYWMWGGTCAQKAASSCLWIDCQPSALWHIDANGKFPLYVLYVREFERPVILQTILLPAQERRIVCESVAIKFIENNTQFQVFYDADSKLIKKRVPVQVFSLLHASPIGVVSSRNPPSFRMHTYALDRVTKLVSKIDRVKFAQWYEIFERMEKGTLAEGDLTSVAADMCAVVDRLENSTISG